MGRLVLGHVDSIPFESDEAVDITLTITNEDGLSESFTNTVTPVEADQYPQLSIDSLEYSANSVLFFSNLMFDPYDQLGDVSGISFDFGDESSDSLEDFDGANFKIDHNYAEASEYEVSLNIENEEGETYSHQETIEVLGEEDSYSAILPFADFRVDKASWAPGTRIYVDQSLSPLSPIVTYLWNLGDGTTAYGEEVLHFYDEGAYDVSLTVITEDGASKTITREIIILSDATNVMANLDCWQTDILKIECDLMGLAREENLSNLMIHFGDSELSEENASVYEVSGSYGEVNLEYEYAASGEYTITYAAFTSPGDEITQEITVNVLESSGNEAPIADLACYQADGLSVDCQAFGSLDNDGYIVNYFYDFGDGNTLSTSDSQAYYTYADYGTYEVSLTVTDNLGDSSSTSYTVSLIETFNNQPLASFDCWQEDDIYLRCDAGSSSDEDGEIVSYLFQTSNGDIFYENSLKFISVPHESISISLMVYDDDGAASAIVTKNFDLVYSSSLYPVAHIECNSLDDLAVSCNAASSYDSRGHSLAYEFSNNGTLISNESSFSYVFSTEGVQEIDLSVTNEFGLSSTTKAQVESVYDSGDAFNASLSCLRIGVLTIDCSIGKTTSDELTISWYIDGVIIEDEERSNLLYQFDTLGEYEVKSIQSNGAISKEYSYTFNLDSILPEAKFSYSYGDDGELVLDASQSADNGRTVSLYQWSIPNKQINIETMSPYITLDSDAYEGDEISLTIQDEIGNTSEVKQIVSSNGNLDSHNFDLVINKLYGEASKDILFELNIPEGESVDDYTVVWDIDGETYEQVELSYVFDTRGEKDVSVTISKEGRSTLIEKSFIIDEISWKVSDEGSFYLFDPMGIFIDNYIPKSSPTITLSTGDVLFLNNVEDTDFFGTIMPMLSESSTDISAQLNIDGDDYEISFDFLAPVYSDTPVADGLEHLAVLSAYFEESMVGTLYENDQALSNEVADLVDELGNTLFSEDFDHTLQESQMFEFILRRMTLEARNSLSQETVFNDQGSLERDFINGVFGTFIESTYARDIESVIDDNFECRSKLNIYSSSTARRYQFRVLFNAINFFLAFSLDGGVVSSLVSTAVFAIGNIVAQINEHAELMKLTDTLIDCKNKIMLPYIQNVEGIALDKSSFSNVNGKTGLYPGFNYDTSFSYPFGNVANENIHKENRVYKKFKEAVSGAYANFSDQMSNDIALFANVYWTEFPSVAISNVVLDKLLSIQKSINVLKDISNTLRIQSDASYENVEVDSNFKIKLEKGPNVSFRTSSTLFGEIISENSRYKETLLNNNAVVEVRVDFTGEGVFPFVRNVNLLESFYIFDGCNGVRLVRHSNGGGFRSITSDVDKNVKIENSIVCGESEIKLSTDDGTINIENSQIYKSTISGKDISIQNSEVSESVVLSGANISNSSIALSSSVAKASVAHTVLIESNIIDSRSIPNSSGGVTGPVVADDGDRDLVLKNVEVITDDEGVSGSSIRASGSISGLRILNSTIDGTLYKDSNINLPEGTQSHMNLSVLNYSNNALVINSPSKFYMYDSSIWCDSTIRGNSCSSMSFNKSLSMSGSRVDGFGFSGATVNMTDAKVYNTSASSPGLIIGDNSISGEGQEINVSAVDGGVIDSLTLSGGSRIGYKKIGSGVTVSSGSSVWVNKISSKANISNSFVSDSNMKTTISGNIIGSIIEGLSVTNSISNKSNQYCYQDSVENEDGTRTLVDRYICEDR